MSSEEIGRLIDAIVDNDNRWGVSADPVEDLVIALQDDAAFEEFAAQRVTEIEAARPGARCRAHPANDGCARTSGVAKASARQATHELGLEASGRTLKPQGKRAHDRRLHRGVDRTGHRRRAVVITRHARDPHSTRLRCSSRKAHRSVTNFTRHDCDGPTATEVPIWRGQPAAGSCSIGARVLCQH